MKVIKAIVSGVSEPLRIKEISVGHTKSGIVIQLTLNDAFNFVKGEQCEFVPVPISRKPCEYNIDLNSQHSLYKRTLSNSPYTNQRQISPRLNSNLTVEPGSPEEKSLVRSSELYTFEELERKLDFTKIQKQTLKKVAHFTILQNKAGPLACMNDQEIESPLHEQRTRITVSGLCDFDRYSTEK